MKLRNEELQKKGKVQMDVSEIREEDLVRSLWHLQGPNGESSRNTGQG